MKPRTKIILTLIALIFVAGVSYALYIWYMPARDVTNEKGIEVTATAIYDSFANDESKANSLYLDKVIQVTGEIAEVKKNQAGQTVVILKSDDPIFGVNCTFKNDPGVLHKKDAITFKGICTGFLSDVVINQGIIVKQ
jgi:tRNA_anti-like